MWAISTWLSYECFRPALFAAISPAYGNICRHSTFIITIFSFLLSPTIGLDGPLIVIRFNFMCRAPTMSFEQDMLLTLRLSIVNLWVRRFVSACGRFYKCR